MWRLETVHEDVPRIPLSLRVRGAVRRTVRPGVAARALGRGRVESLADELSSMSHSELSELITTLETLADSTSPAPEPEPELPRRRHLMVVR